MNNFLICLAVIAILTLLIFIQHIWQTPEMKTKNKISLAAAGAALIIAMAGDSLYIVLEGNPAYNSFCYLLILAEYLLCAWVLPLEYYGFGTAESGKAAAAAAGIFCLIMILTAPFGLVYYISDSGYYEMGMLSAVLLVWEIASLVFSLHLLICMSRKFDHRKNLTLCLIGILQVAGMIMNSMTGLDLISTITFALAFILIYSYYDYLTERNLYNNLYQSHIRNRELSLQLVQALVNAVDAKDKYTHGHSQRVADYSVLLAEKLGWDEKRLYQLKYEALMHDVGKIGIPDSVLNKAGRLNDSEFTIIKSHSVLGSQILSGVDSLSEAYQAARWHHERYDGKGYPDGKKGTDIPEIARIISIADTYDAMNSDRIYRKALPRDVILQELKRIKGTQLDPEFTDVFIGLVESGAADEIAASGRHDENDSADELSDKLKDFLNFLSRENEQESTREEYDEEIEFLRSQLYHIADRYHADIEAASVQIAPKDGVDLKESEFDEAAGAMQKALKEYAVDILACCRISRTCIILACRKASGQGLKDKLPLALGYYYKIYKAENISISYHAIERLEED